jgi:HK97 family phage prohead protease
MSDNQQPARPPIEFRNAPLVGVNFAERTVELVVVPYEEEAMIEYRGEMWRETFLRGAFDGVESRTDRIPANRDHDHTRLTGRAIALHPSRIEGLVGEIRMADTPLGNETLELAHEDMVSGSAGFGVRGSDQILDRPYRRIKRAFLDHIAFVAAPAYQGARVLAVRDEEEPRSAADLPKLVTPNLDDVLTWMNSRPAR